MKIYIRPLHSATENPNEPFERAVNYNFCAVLICELLKSARRKRAVNRRFFLSMYAKLMLMVDNGFSDCKRDVLNLCSKYIYIMYRSKIDNNLFMKVSMLARNNRVLF